MWTCWMRLRQHDPAAPAHVSNATYADGASAETRANEAAELFLLFASTKAYSGT